MAVEATFERCWRIRSEASFNAASPEGGAEWNIGGNGGGTDGWLDLPVTRESDGLQPKSTIIYPSTASCARAMNAALPIAGAYPAELGSLEFAVYPELIDRILKAVFGTVTRTPTAGTAALASTPFASLATLDTQSDGTEQFKFTISSSTAASAAEINIIQNAVTQETIVIGTNAGSVDGDYYSKGGYDGSSNAITFTVSGTVTAGNVVVSGIDKNTNVFEAGDTNPSLVIEQKGRPEADIGSGYSEYFPGIVIPTLALAYDRSAADNLLMATATIQGLNPTEATAGSYANDAANYYQPFAGWTAALTLDGATWSEVVAVNMTIQPSTELYATSSGDQQPTGKIEGYFEVFGTMTILPADETQWDVYRAQTVQDVELTFTTPHYIIDTEGYSLKFEFTQFTLEDYSRGAQSMAQSAEIAFRTIYDDDDGPAKVTVVSRMPV